MTDEAESRIARIFHPRDWAELTPAFRQIMSLTGEGGARARARADVRINRDLREERLHAALVALDDTIIKMLAASDWEHRVVYAPPNPAEGCSTLPPYEEGRVCIWRADLNREYPMHAAMPATAADGSGPSQSPQAEQQPPAAPAPVTSATLPPAEDSSPSTREAAAAPPSDAEVEPEGLPSATQQSVAKPAPERAEATRWQRERTKAAIRTIYSPDGIRPKDTSIKRLTARINRLQEFQNDKVSEDTVRLADIEIRAEAALKK